jgi:hypothetical protein
MRDTRSESVKITGVKRFRRAAKFFARELSLPACNIHISWTNKCMPGACAFMESDVLTPGYFAIKFNRKVKKDTDCEILLAHEMIHVEQHVKGLVEDMWMHGKWYSSWKGADPIPLDTGDLGTAYYDLPWEKDAYERQDELYSRWLTR